MTAKRFRLTVTLATGVVHSFDVVKLPRHYASWLMQQLPYGTVFTGATFKREAIS